MEAQHRRRRILRKRSFTLFEIVISISILAIAASLILWNLRGFLERHRFLDSSEKIVEEMQKLKKFALYYQVEMEIELISLPEGVSYKVFSDEPLPFFHSSFVKLPAIEEISNNNKAVTRLHLTFFPNGLVYPSSIIGFHQNEKALSMWVDLSKDIKLKAVFPKKAN